MTSSPSRWSSAETPTPGGWLPCSGWASCRGSPTRTRLRAARETASASASDIWPASSTIERVETRLELRAREQPRGSADDVDGAVHDRRLDHLVAADNLDRGGTGSVPFAVLHANGHAKRGGELLDLRQQRANRVVRDRGDADRCAPPRNEPECRQRGHVRFPGSGRTLDREASTLAGRGSAVSRPRTPSPRRARSTQSAPSRRRGGSRSSRSRPARLGPGASGPLATTQRPRSRSAASCASVANGVVGIRKRTAPRSA